MQEKKEIIDLKDSILERWTPDANYSVIPCNHMLRCLARKWGHSAI